MTTGKAIAALREKLRITQRELADRLGVTVTSISRYENGKEPSRQVLARLADLAESSTLNFLRDIFAAKRRAGIVARLESLPSAGTQRRVSLDDLKRWESAPQFLADELLQVREVYMDIIRKHPIDALDQQRLGATNRRFFLLKDALLDLSHWIEPYISIPKQKEKPSGKTTK
jgi:transcriptional regulator with XRE-family HTH domain